MNHDDMHMEFSPEQLDAFLQGGVSLTGAGAYAHPNSSDAAAETAVRHGALIAFAFTEEEAARHIGCSETEVRQRIAEGSLYAVQTPEGARVARFQFTTDGEVPHVGEVMRKVPADAHPVAVERWFTEPDPDLLRPGAEEPVSPREWLLAGGSSGHLERLADEL